MTGANNYSGGTTVAAGTLAIGNSSALGTGALSLLSGTTLRFAANGLTIGNSITVTGDPNFNVPTGSTDTISGAITGSGEST